MSQGIPVPIHIFEFDLPQTVDLKYESKLRTDEEGKEFLKKKSILRKHVLRAIENKLYSEYIKSSKPYLSFLFSMEKFLEEHNIKENIYFSWSPSLTSSSYLDVCDLNWEILFVLFNLSLSYRYLVIEKIIEMKAESEHTELTKFLKISGGIFEYIKDNIISKQFVNKNSLGYVPELYNETYVLFINLTLAELHEIAALVIYQKGSYMSTAKLCMTATKFYQDCIASLKILKKELGYGYHIMKQNIEKYIELKMTLFESLSHLYASIHHYNNKNYGLSVCHINKSFEIINGTKNSKSKENNNIWNSFTLVKSFISELKDKYNDENNNIYHEFLSDVDLSIEVRVLTKLTPYEVPENEEIKLTLTPSECSIL